MPNAQKRSPVVPRRVKIAIKALFEEAVFDLAGRGKGRRHQHLRLREEVKKDHVMQTCARRSAY